MSQGNSCVAILKKQKCLFFFSFTKSENRRAEQVLRGVCYQWERKKVGKGHGRVKIVQILCTHVCKWKNETC
jgi:hypothetical protein